MLIPLPKELMEIGDVLQLKRGKSQDILVSTGNSFESETVKVIRQELRRLMGPFGGVPVSIEWKSGLVNAPSVPEQAYALDVTEDGIHITANTAVGALYGISTLRQLKTAPGTFRKVFVRDWPDTEIRIAARPLLCAEACTSALDWGDGHKGFIRRWKEEIDFAWRFRFNGFFAWGFSWEPEPFPGFGKCFRIINSYARARGVRLSFGGHGISKFDPGRVRTLADADRRSKGLGTSVRQTRQCSKIDPEQKDDVYCGTCRSDEKLRAQKIKDLAAFVKAVEPSMLYIHHEDLNTISETQKYFWDCRCSECRKKWPDDRIEAVAGGAGAIADTMNAYSEALSSVPESVTGYNAMRDCVVLYTSPGYGDWSENTEQWERVKTLWCNVVRQLRHPENFSISIREQFRNEKDSELRVSELSRSIHEIAPECGVHVFFAGGADLYYNNAPFCAAPEMFNSCDGARAVFAFNGIIFQRPQLLYNAECLWNMRDTSKSQVKELPLTRAECNQKLHSMINDALPEAYHAPDGWLASACRSLYGSKAGELLFRYQLLRSPSGCYPLSVLYYETRMRRKLFTIMDNPGTDRAAEEQYWMETLEISRQGLNLLRNALKFSTAYSGQLCRELEQQKKTLETGIVLAQAARAFFAGDYAEYADAVRRFGKKVKQFPEDFIAADEGDTSFYAGYLDELKKRMPE